MTNNRTGGRHADIYTKPFLLEFTGSPGLHELNLLLGELNANERSYWEKLMLLRDKGVTVESLDEHKEGLESILSVSEKKTQTVGKYNRFKQGEFLKLLKELLEISDYTIIKSKLAAISNKVGKSRKTYFNLYIKKTIKFFEDLS